MLLRIKVKVIFIEFGPCLKHLWTVDSKITEYVVQDFEIKNCYNLFYYNIDDLLAEI